jgi:acetate kinase
MTSADAVVVLALNPGSSSLKAAVRDPQLRLSLRVERLGTDAATATVTRPQAEPVTAPVTGDLDQALTWVRDTVVAAAAAPDVVAHRVVHGGPRHDRPTLIDDALIDDLRDAIPLAPLHLPAAIDAIQRAREAWPDAAHVACFDTAFHRSLPDEGRRLPLPDDVAALGVRRYGFHGLAVQSVVDAVPDLGPAVVAHLGSGCSVTGVAGGRSRHTTMSLTPTSGTMSATRSGDLDPEIVLFLLSRPDWDADAIREMLNRSSGVAAFSGGTVDMRDLLDARSDPGVDLAIRAFTRSVAMGIASCATALERWEALVFSGGIGEHSAAIREEICARLSGLVGAPAGAASASEGLRACGVRVLTVAAEEESVMDREARAVVSS